MAASRFSLIQQKTVPVSSSKVTNVTKPTRRTLISTQEYKPEWVTRENFSSTDYPIACHIQHRRLQMLVHSRIYYKLNNNIVDDATWAKWALDLVQFQQKYPQIAERVCFHKYFLNFDGSTGFNLPLDHSWVVRKAEQLLGGK